jgi:hypothetical protein
LGVFKSSTPAAYVLEACSTSASVAPSHAADKPPAPVARAAFALTNLAAPFAAALGAREGPAFVLCVPLDLQHFDRVCPGCLGNSQGLRPHWPLALGDCETAALAAPPLPSASANPPLLTLPHLETAITSLFQLLPVALAISPHGSPAPSSSLAEPASLFASASGDCEASALAAPLPRVFAKPATPSASRFGQLRNLFLCQLSDIPSSPISLSPLE